MTDNLPDPREEPVDLGAAMHAGFEAAAARAPALRAIQTANTQGERFDAILAFYRALWPVMKATPTNRWALDPYEVDWTCYFTPIENLLWGDIRQQGIVLYPQHPIAGYFVDFGHPVVKVAVECDGLHWHQDKARDAERQTAIEAKGWTVYRLTGAQCWQDSREFEDDDTGAIHIEPSVGQQLMREIGARHHISIRSAA